MQMSLRRFYLGSLKLRHFYCLVAAIDLLSRTVNAGEMTITVELPILNVAEYHEPYVAFWLEDSKGESINLAAWYQLEERGQKSEKGEEWLKDMRQWWRRIGRNTDMPADGISGATRVPGKHSLHFKEGVAPLKNLNAGEYVLVVEAAREVGGRELVKVPFVWPVTSSVAHKSKGEKELGAVNIAMKP
jgi:hypothetical protein